MKNKKQFFFFIALTTALVSNAEGVENKITTSTKTEPNKNIPKGDSEAVIDDFKDSMAKLAKEVATSIKSDARKIVSEPKVDMNAAILVVKEILAGLSKEIISEARKHTTVTPELDSNIEASTPILEAALAELVAKELISESSMTTPEADSEATNEFLADLAKGIVKPDTNKIIEEELEVLNEMVQAQRGTADGIAYLLCAASLVTLYLTLR